MALQPIGKEDQIPVADMEVFGPEDNRPRFNPMDNPLSDFIKKEDEAYKEIQEAPDKNKEYYENKYDGEYNEYTTARKEAYDAGNFEEVKKWDNYWLDKKGRNDNFNKYWECTSTNCDDDEFNMVNNPTTEFRYDNLAANKPLLLSLRRTQDDYRSSDQKILREYASDMTWKDVNSISLAWTVLKTYFFSTDQEKKDTALQMSTWTKVKGTGEGSRDTSQQVGDISIAAIADPSNLISLAAGPAGVTAKQLVQRKAMTEAAKYILKRVIVSKASVTGLKYGGVMAGFAGLHNLGKQRISLNAEIADKIDWKSAGIDSLIGFGIGAGIGALVGGASVKFNQAMNRFMRRKNINNKQALDEMRATVTDEASLFRWLKDIGWTKKEALEELNFLDKNKFEFDKGQGKWVSQETGAEYKPQMVERFTEKSYFGAETEAPSWIQKIGEVGQKELDAAYISVNSLNVPIPFTKTRQAAFEFFDKVLGSDFTRATRSADAILTRIGKRQVARSIKEANVAVDLNTNRIGSELRKLEKSSKEELGNINTLLRTREVNNDAQRQYLKIWDTTKTDIIYKAYKLKIIKAKEYSKWKKDKSYIPRVWNTQSLLTEEGAGRFSKELSAMWSKDPSAVRNIIGNLIGLKDSDVQKLSKDSFSTKNIRTIFRNKVDREMDIKRSSHLEHERKIDIPEKFEHRLDQFMANPTDRLISFAYDGFRRNEFASRFGAKDQLINKQIKALQKQGKGDEADHLAEQYFTIMGDATKSKVLKRKQDVPHLMRAVSKINAAQTITKLGTAAIPNATQAFVNGATMMAKSGNLVTAPFKAISSIVRAIVKDKASAEIVNRAGVLGELDLARIATENAPHSRIFDIEFKKGLQWVNEPTKFLKGVGFMGVEAINRGAAAHMAHGHVATVHHQFLKRISQGKRDTVKTRRLQRELRDLGIDDPYKADLTANDYAISGHMFNKHVNFSGESYNLPSHWQGPWFKLFTKFKSFMFYQAKFLQRHVVDEVLIHGNPKPLAMYLTAAGVAGNGAEIARAFVKDKDIKENRKPLELLITGIGNAGGAGLWWDTMKQVAEQGPSGAFSIAGPTASDVAYTIQDLSKGDIDKIIMRLVPNVPGKNQLTQQWRDQ